MDENKMLEKIDETAEKLYDKATTMNLRADEAEESADREKERFFRGAANSFLIASVMVGTLKAELLGGLPND